MTSIDSRGFKIVWNIQEHCRVSGEQLCWVETTKWFWSETFSLRDKVRCLMLGTPLQFPDQIRYPRQIVKRHFCFFWRNFSWRWSCPDKTLHSKVTEVSDFLPSQTFSGKPNIQLAPTGKEQIMPNYWNMKTAALGVWGAPGVALKKITIWHSWPKSCISPFVQPFKGWYQGVVEVNSSEPGGKIIWTECLKFCP